MAPGSHPRAEAQCLNYCIISATLQCRKSGQVSSVQSGSVLLQQCEVAVKVSLASADISRQDITVVVVDSFEVFFTVQSQLIQTGIRLEKDQLSTYPVIHPKSDNLNKDTCSEKKFSSIF